MNGDYLPYNFTQGKEMLTQRIRNSKKGDDLMKQYQGKAKDLNGYAQLMGSQIDSAQVVFASNGDPKLENEPGLIGRMAAAKQGVLQGPCKGENAVYVYQVVKQEKAERKPSKEELQQPLCHSAVVAGHGQPRAMYKILSKATKVKKIAHQLLLIPIDTLLMSSSPAGSRPRDLFFEVKMHFYRVKLGP